MQTFRFNVPLAGLVLLLAAPSCLTAQVSLSITVAPPPIPVYEQPPCPEDGYIWTPGRWAWTGDSYSWIPGNWVAAPAVGMVWTPGYWGWDNQSYFFHEGYWGNAVGFYGGINYGYGYGGTGFQGGRWRGRHYSYNRAVTNIGSGRLTNVYNKAATTRNTTNVAYNGGRGGIRSAPTRQEQNVKRQPGARPVARVVEPPPTHPGPPPRKAVPPLVLKPRVSPAQPLVKERAEAPNQRPAPAPRRAPAPSPAPRPAPAPKQAPAAVPQRAPSHADRPMVPPQQAAPRPSPEARPREASPRENEDRHRP